jgi:hypothetical protein
LQGHVNAIGSIREDEAGALKSSLVLYFDLALQADETLSFAANGAAKSITRWGRLHISCAGFPKHLVAQPSGIPLAASRLLNDVAGHDLARALVVINFEDPTHLLQGDGHRPQRVGVEGIAL